MLSNYLFQQVLSLYKQISTFDCLAKMQDTKQNIKHR